MSSTACFSASVGSVSVQSNGLRNFSRDSASSFGFNFFFFHFVQFFEDSCLYWDVILSFSRIFGFRKPESVIPLIWFVCFEQFAQVKSQLRITLRNHTENCRVFRLDELGLLRSDYGEFGSLCVFLD